MASLLIANKPGALLRQPRPTPRMQVACAVAPQHKQQQQQQQHEQKPFAGVLAAGFAAVALLTSAPLVGAAEQMQSLADVLRPTYSFIDANKDGVVTQAELDVLAREVGQAGDDFIDAPRDELLAFTARVFDLNQDGKLTTDELLTGLAMDSAVSGNTLSEDVYKVFDRNGDGYVDLNEWKKPFGDLGRYGEEIKEYTFNRVEYLSDGDNKMDVPELANALTLMRVQVLGY